MGEAKRNLERLRKLMLIETEQWSRLPSVEEEAALTAVLALPAVTVHRDPRAAEMGMPSKECHANCAWYAENDPSGQSTRVLGWWKQPSALVLHSVIQTGPNFVCITPQQDPRAGGPFTFIPDPEVIGKREGDHVAFYRGDFAIHPGLRLDPAATTEYMAEARGRLQTGIPPFEAWNIDYRGRNFDDAG